MKANKIALGLLAGVAAGAVVGILFAPAKGSETRKKIQQKGNDYASGLKSKLDKLVHNGEDLVTKSNAKYENIKNINPKIST